MAKATWERDNFTCQYCGFQSQKYQEVVNRDNNYRNNVADNLITACCFCTQCQFIESVGEQGYGGGTLIYFPEMTQAEINALCHVLFCAMVNNSGYQDIAQSILQSLRMRSSTVDKLLGDGMSDPAAFGQLVLDYTENRKLPEMQQMMSKLRLLPARGRFNKQIEYWAKTAALTTS